MKTRELSRSMQFRSRWLLLTGASSGLGLQMARRFAQDHGANLVLVARRESRLHELAQELREKSGVQVETIAADLSDMAQVDRVFETAIKGKDLYGAVLNAGITHFGPNDELSWTDFQRMLSTNVESTVRLTMHLAPYLEKKNQAGGIMLVSSMAGLVPVAYQSAYSGTKGFLVNFGCALHHELVDRNVSLTTFVPGGIQTEMTSGERFNSLRSWLMPVDQCAGEAIEAFRSRRYLAAPGVVNRWGYVFVRMLPQRFVTGRVAATYRSALAKVKAAATALPATTTAMKTPEA